MSKGIEEIISMEKDEADFKQNHALSLIATVIDGAI